MDSPGKTFLIVAGEVSGDHHAAPVIAALKGQLKRSEFWGLGGDAMIEEGLHALHHVKDLSVTGFVEVLKHLSFFKKVMSDVLNYCGKSKPDAAILVDYPGFNIRLGKRLKKLGIPVYYYISPQVWAWKKGRVRTMRQFIKRMFVIFPFEKHFYEQHGIPVVFTGHPLVEKDFKITEAENFFSDNKIDPERALVAILPGSRRNEVEQLTQPLLDAINELQQANPGIQFGIAGLSSLSSRYYAPFMGIEDVFVLTDQTYSLVAHSRAAIVASGTASLEVAFLGVPLVVVYKIAPLSYLIGKMLVHIDHLAMPNLILNERAIPELIQNDARGDVIATNLTQLLIEGPDRRVTKEKLTRLRGLLGDPGCANMVASSIVGDLD